MFQMVDDAYELSNKDIQKSLCDLNTTQQELSCLIDKQQEYVNTIETNICNASQYIEESKQELIEASGYNKSRIVLGAILGGVAGVVIGGPLGFFIGAKIGILTIGTGIATGAVIGAN